MTEFKTTSLLDLYFNEIKAKKNYRLNASLFASNLKNRIDMPCLPIIEIHY